MISMVLGKPRKSFPGKPIRGNCRAHFTVSLWGLRTVYFAEGLRAAIDTILSRNSSLKQTHL